MCLICQILAEQESARKGEIGITTAAQAEQVSSSNQRDQDRAHINLSNAEAVRKLAEAAQILEDLHRGAAAKRVVDFIEHLVPAQPAPGPTPDEQPCSNPAFPETRKERINELLAALEADGVMIVGAFDTKLA